MKKVKQVVEPVADDRIAPLSVTPSELAHNRAFVVTHGENGVQFRFHDAGGISRVPLPRHARITREGGDQYKVQLLYLPGDAPAIASGKDSRVINTSAYDGQTFIIQTGTDPVTGKMKGKQYKKLYCTGWSYLNGLTADDDQRYEQIVCLTEVVNDWDSKVLDLNTLGMTKEKLLM